VWKGWRRELGFERECGLRRSGNKRIWEGRKCGEGGEEGAGVERGGIGRREWGEGGGGGGGGQLNSLNWAHNYHMTMLQMHWNLAARMQVIEGIKQSPGVHRSRKQCQCSAKYEFATWGLADDWQYWLQPDYSLLSTWYKECILMKMLYPCSPDRREVSLPSCMQF